MRFATPEEIEVLEALTGEMRLRAVEMLETFAALRAVEVELAGAITLVSNSRPVIAP